MSRTRNGFGLLLFSVDPLQVSQATTAGINGFIVDWENLGKVDRQEGADTEVNYHTADDLRRVRGATAACVFCRINRLHPGTAEEVERALAAGADELLLPMVRSVEQVQQVLTLLHGRAQLGILIETVEALALVDDLARLPVSRVYVGLNDLAIDRGTPNIFTALVDGTVERLRERIRCPFGFGGLTLPEFGTPIPCRLLAGEMARLDCQFTFLRRSFLRDTGGQIESTAVDRIHAALAEARQRSGSAIAADRKELEKAILDWRPNGTPRSAIRHV